MVQSFYRENYKQPNLTQLGDSSQILDSQSHNCIQRQFKPFLTLTFILFEIPEPLHTSHNLHWSDQLRQCIRGCIQKFPGLPPGARTANGTALRHWVQLYRYFMSQSSKSCRHNPLCCFSASVYCCCCLFRYRLSPVTFGYTLVFTPSAREKDPQS
jgi:hypothetical protein